MQSVSQSRSSEWYFAGLIALAGTALKILQWYNSRPLWLDEEMVILNARDRTLAELAGPLWLDQAAPFGWMALQRGVITAFGTDDRAVRAVPVLFGIATIWTAVWVARRWMTPIAGVVFVMLCSIAQWMTFYALELKPYSADACSALLLAALAIWAAEEHRPSNIDTRRTTLWWIAAAVMQWFSFGATFVVPVCALALVITAWRRGGERTALTVAAQGVIWLACFGVHYMLSMRTASHDEYLRTYWANGFPPADAGVVGAFRWMAAQLEPLASHPGSTTRWVLFWLTAAYGAIVSLRHRPLMGMVLIGVPISGFVFALVRVAPLHDRLALWITPVLYAAIAVAAGDVVEKLRTPHSARNLAALVPAVIFSVSAWWVTQEILALGSERYIIRGANHGLDDRRAVRLLMNERQPGDVLLANHFSLPAVWWYGNIDLGAPNHGSRFADGAPLFEIRHVYFGKDCRQSTQTKALSEALAGAPRVLVYLGFDSESPPGFQKRVLEDLTRFGTRVRYSGVSDGIAAIYDLRQPPADSASDVVLSEGCVLANPAARW